MKTFLRTIKTTGNPFGLPNDAARPYAVVEISKVTGLPTHVLSRYETERGAKTACTKSSKREG